MANKAFSPLGTKGLFLDAHRHHSIPTAPLSPINLKYLPASRYSVGHTSRTKSISFRSRLC